MLKILILSIAAVAFVIYMVKENEKEKHKLSGTKKKTTQDLMNVIDIDEQGIISTQDGYLIGFLATDGIRTDLLNKREQEGLIEQQTADVSTNATDWQILAVSRPEDNSDLIEQYNELLDQTQDPIRKRLLREAIRYQNRLLLEGANVERQFYIKLWEMDCEGAKGELLHRLRQMAKCFSGSRWSCELVKRDEVITLCNLVHNPGAILFEPEVERSEDV